MRTHGDDAQNPSSLEIRVEDAIKVTATLQRIFVWNSYNFAPEWYQDATSEAQRSGHAARRREIIFAVCAAESYLFEWVLWGPLSGNIEQLNTYFPVTTIDSKGIKRHLRSSVLDKWKEVPKKLLENSKIKATPDFGGNPWKNFVELVWLRNGLIHASASRPQADVLPDDEQAYPSIEKLDALSPGWAVGVVSTLIKNLHAAIGTDPPTWLVDP